MSLPTRAEAHTLLESHVTDPYQRHHAEMVGMAMEGYANLYNENKELWYLTGLLHDIDFEKHPDTHPKNSLEWFKDWGYGDDLIHAVEAHAYEYNGFTTLPQTKLAATLMACDEISGIFYAYKKLNPVPYGNMKVSSIKKKFNEESFAAKIDRKTITRGIEALGVDLDTHIGNLIRFFSQLPSTS